MTRRRGRLAIGTANRQADESISATTERRCAVGEPGIVALFRGTQNVLQLHRVDGPRPPRRLSVWRKAAELRKLAIERQTLSEAIDDFKAIMDEQKRQAAMAPCTTMVSSASDAVPLLVVLVFSII